jgi:hypothetical protein
VGTRKTKNVLCQRVKKDGTPCQNKALLGADFCLSHNVSQKRGWFFWFSVITGIATLIAFIIAIPPFYTYLYPPVIEKVKPSEPVKRTAFFLTSYENNSSPLFSTFEGSYLIYPDRIELQVDAVTFKHNHLTNENISVTSITSGLAIHSKTGSWRIIHNGDHTPINVLIEPTDKIYGTENIQIKIPYPPDLDLKNYHLVMGPMIKTESKWDGKALKIKSESHPEWLAHSDIDIFKDYKIAR